MFNKETPLDKIKARMVEDEIDTDIDQIIDYIQIRMLGFCACGIPEDNLEYVMDGLNHINRERPDGINHSDWFKEWEEKGKAIFGNEQSKYFFFYWCDKEELTEHGSSIPGWLTDKGHNLLSVLKELDENGAFNN